MSSQIVGTIQEIGETKVYPKKDGQGNVNITKLKIDGKYYTCFLEKAAIDSMAVGQKVDVTYTEKENEYEGKKYVNYNISAIGPHIEDGQPAPEPQPASQPQQPVEKAKGENTVNVGDKTFKVTIQEI